DECAADSDDHALPVEPCNVPTKEWVAEQAANGRAHDADDDGYSQSLGIRRLARIPPGQNELRNSPCDEAEQAPQQNVDDHDWSSRGASLPCEAGDEAGTVFKVNSPQMGRGCRWLGRTGSFLH